MPPLRAHLADGAIALTSGAVVIAVSAWTVGALSPVMTGALLVGTATLSLRRSWPGPVVAVLTVLTAGLLAAGYAATPAIGMVSIAVFTAARRMSWWRSSVAAGGALCAILPAYLAHAEYGQEMWSAVSLIAMALSMPAVLPVAARLRRESMARARSESIRRHVEEERLEIAGEAHDVLGHALAVINMQAGVALHVRERRPDQMHEALAAIGQASREALNELDVTFGVSRTSGEPAAGRFDLGLDQLGALLAMVRCAGLEVSLTVEGPRTSLLPQVEQAAYRIVQESLTNVLHHAGPVRATVDLRYEPTALLLYIGNEDGTEHAGLGAEAGRPPHSGGNGIPGMRQRASALGGSVQAGPRADGGFLVTARLPLEECSR